MNLVAVALSACLRFVEMLRPLITCTTMRQHPRECIRIVAVWFQQNPASFIFLLLLSAVSYDLLDWLVLGSVRRNRNAASLCSEMHCGEMPVAACTNL
jgi:hypothetical protein